MKTVLTRKELAERWGLEEKSLYKMESNQVIHRLPGLPGVKFSIEEIEEVERVNPSDYKKKGLLEFKRLERDRNEWKERYLRLKNLISKSSMDLAAALNEVMEEEK